MLPTLRSLYICYFPITEPLVQTQVVAYLAGLARHGHTIHLLTFETEQLTPTQKRQWRKRLKEQNIIWHHLRYHKRPSLPATVYDVFCGVAVGLKIIRRYRLTAVHARSHVPATMGLLLKKLTGCRFIFDIRGLMAEEYEDAGIWQRDSLPFRVTKALEGRAIENADGLVVLTRRVKQLLFDKEFPTPLHVIPCCADLTQIEEQSKERVAMRARLNLDGKTVLVYAGKLSGIYMQQEMVDFFEAARQILFNLHFLVLTQSEPQLIISEFERRNVPATDYTVTKVEPSRIGEYLAASDLAISFREPSPSQIAASPTKIGEYLAAGLPVVCNVGIGDVDANIASNHVGELVREFTPLAYEQAAQQMRSVLVEGETPQRCRQAAHDHFSLEEIGIPRYHALYSAIAQNAGQGQTRY